jgi:hypothetical protein
LWAQEKDARDIHSRSQIKKIFVSLQCCGTACPSGFIIMSDGETVMQSEDEANVSSACLGLPDVLYGVSMVTLGSFSHLGSSQRK